MFPKVWNGFSDCVFVGILPFKSIKIKVPRKNRLLLVVIEEHLFIKTVIFDTNLSKAFKKYLRFRKICKRIFFWFFGSVIIVIFWLFLVFLLFFLWRIFFFLFFRRFIFFCLAFFLLLWVQLSKFCS